ncbi:MAG: flagellar FlbD family protein [Ilumatobacteraceae bacterium]
MLERLEAHPDTVVHLVSGETYIVKESIADIISMIRSYRSSLIAEALVASSTEGAA